MVSHTLRLERRSADIVYYQQHVVRASVVVARGDKPQRDSHECECNFYDEQLGVEL